MDDSVAAVVGGRSDHGDHFPLGPAQFGAAAHEVGVEIIMGLQRLHIQAVDLEDIVDDAVGLHVFFIQLFQPSAGLPLTNDFYPGHLVSNLHLEFICW